MLLNTLASFWPAYALWWQTGSGSDLPVFSSHTFFNLPLSLSQPPAEFWAHILSLSLLSCGIDTVVLPVPSLSLFPLRMPQSTQCYGFSKGRLPSISCLWDDTIISFQTSTSAFLKFRTQKSGNKHAKVSGPWHLPWGPVTNNKCLLF